MDGSSVHRGEGGEDKSEGNLVSSGDGVKLGACGHHVWVWRFFLSHPALCEGSLSDVEDISLLGVWVGLLVRYHPKSLAPCSRPAVAPSGGCQRVERPPGHDPRGVGNATACLWCWTRTGFGLLLLLGAGSASAKAIGAKSSGCD